MAPNSLIDNHSKRPLFPMGLLLATPGALALLKEVHRTPFDFLERHQCGDWGDVDPEDAKANTAALHYGTRLLSAYNCGSRKLWVITEADRSSTCLLLPEDY